MQAAGVGLGQQGGFGAEQPGERAQWERGGVQAGVQGAGAEEELDSLLQEQAREDGLLLLQQQADRRLWEQQQAQQLQQWEAQHQQQQQQQARPPPQAYEGAGPVVDAAAVAGSEEDSDEREGLEGGQHLSVEDDGDLLSAMMVQVCAACTPFCPLRPPPNLPPPPPHTSPHIVGLPLVALPSLAL